MATGAEQVLAALRNNVCRFRDELAARRAHDPRVAGSNPAHATKMNKGPLVGPFFIWVVEDQEGDLVQ